MKSLLLPLHLVFVGLWLGCVLTEVLFERALLGKGPEQELLLAELHKRVDLAVEIPAFVLVLVTGGLMLQSVPPSATLHLKIGFGMIAILANLYCVRLVLMRHAYAKAGNRAAFARADHLQHKVGAIVLLGILAALGTGLSLSAGN